MELFINGILRQFEIDLYIPNDIVSIIKLMYSKEAINSFIRIHW